ncbi:MAG: DUF6051 family protein [Paludibacter sp.]
MNYSLRYQELNTMYKMGVDTDLQNSPVCVRHFSFHSDPIPQMSENTPENLFSDKVSENISFKYPVFVLQKTKKTDRAILLMHGLNERNWSKYLTWAEYLCTETGRAVILFPIAFHVNRSPINWSNPRMLQSIYELRRKQNGNDRSLSFANVALSERISQNPYRFYSSGRQSLNDITQLITNIKSGWHPLFAENTRIDVFAYSIGAFLSQIAFMTNPDNLFAESKLFMFCGGSIFSSMFGESRSIMDRVAFDKLLKYYKEDFSAKNESEQYRDKAFESFYSMILPERNENERLNFFKKMKSRLAGISLVRDKVIPYLGVEKALGIENAKSCINLLDFAFDYSHENPFPVGKTIVCTEVNTSFERVFLQVADFLA